MRSLHPTSLVLALALVAAPAVPCRAAAPAVISPLAEAAISGVRSAAPPAAVREFVELAGRHRAALGLAPLEWDARAALVARAHSADMAERGYFAHADPDGHPPSWRLTGAGVAWRVSGENIARGYTDGAAVFEAWLASPGHRANLENPAFTRHGVGLVRGRWTHVLYAP